LKESWDYIEKQYLLLFEAFPLSLLAFYVWAAAKPPPKHKRAQTCRSIRASVAVTHFNIRNLKYV
jgi:hypothetical protein